MHMAFQRWRNGIWHDYDAQAAGMEDGEGRIEKERTYGIKHWGRVRTMPRIHIQFKTPEMGASGPLRPTSSQEEPYLTLPYFIKITPCCSALWSARRRLYLYNKTSSTMHLLQCIFYNKTQTTTRRLVDARPRRRQLVWVGRDGEDRMGGRWRDGEAHGISPVGGGPPAEPVQPNTLKMRAARAERCAACQQSQGSGSRG
eukprot:6185881-Pleurochrysis_carterae.AAC.2